jgi:hypothetical protein
MFVKNSLTLRKANNNYMTAHAKTAILDSGCTSHFITNNAPCKITKENKPPLTVRMPNNKKILSCNTVKLNLPMINEQARKAYVFGDLNNNLLSVGQLCVTGYDVKFTKHKATVHNNTNIVLTEKRDHTNGLWRSPLADYTIKINNVGMTSHCNHAQNHPNNTNSYLQRYTKVHKSHAACCKNVQDYTNIQDAISYLQATANSPVKTTLVQAIKNGNFTSWPGMTLDNVNKHYNRTIITSKGHMA